VRRVGSERSGGVRAVGGGEVGGGREVGGVREVGVEREVGGGRRGNEMAGRGRGITKLTVLLSVCVMP